MRLYWKTSQPVPGKGEAWVYYECDEKFSILRHLTHFPLTGEVECVAKPLVKKMTDMYLMQKADEEEFRKYHEQVVTFLRGPHAAKYLWPHLDDAQRAEMMNGVLEEFEQ